MIDNDIAIIYVPNRYVAPDGGAPYQFVAITILCYAGDGKSATRRTSTTSSRPSGSATSTPR